MVKKKRRWDARGRASFLQSATIKGLIDRDFSESLGIILVLRNVTTEQKCC